MQVTKRGSVRVDLVGGTLDLEPINLVLKDVVTLNVATSLKAEVKVEKNNSKEHCIYSHDYEKEYKVPLSELTFENLHKNLKFKEMTFILQLIDFFDFETGLNIELRSGAPAGSGLGGSSAMGVTFFSALCELDKKEFTTSEKVARVKAIEARILNQGVTGYQDYYPALTGGVLALIPKAGGIELKQLYTKGLADFLEKHITLVYSNISRDSGINNWDVYKAFFDRNETVVECMEEIANLSAKTYQAIEAEDFRSLLTLIGSEGESRKKLSKQIVPGQIDVFFKTLKESKEAIGMKMCGAGGGGCFIITHESADQQKVKNRAIEAGFKPLDFKVERPLSEN